jgi:hypothetical protein
MSNLAEPLADLSDAALVTLLDIARAKGAKLYKDSPPLFDYLEAAAAREEKRRAGEAVGDPPSLLSVQQTAEDLYAVAEAAGKAFVTAHEMRRRGMLGEDTALMATELETLFASIAEWAIDAAGSKSVTLH